MKEKIIEELNRKIAEEKAWAEAGSWGESIACNNRIQAYEQAIKIVEEINE